jgi:hypothetical protein
VSYSGAVRDHLNGLWISDAGVCYAACTFTAEPVAAWLPCAGSRNLTV